MKKITLCCVSLFCFMSIMAQTETTHWKYQLELDPANREFQVHLDQQRNSSLLKMTNIHRFEEDYFMLGHTLRKSIEDKQLRVYNKSDKPYAKSDISTILDEVYLDSIIVFDEETWEEKIQVIEQKDVLFPSEKTVYQFNQKWSFDNENQKLSNTISSINVLNGFEKKENEKFLFSIKNKASKKTIETPRMIENSSVVWAKKMYYVAEFNNIELRKKILSTAHFNQHKVVSNEYENTPLNLEEIAVYFEGSVDTLLDYNKDEPDHQASVIKGDNLTAKDIIYFKILQDIYFDIETYSFVSKIVAIAPCKIEYDDITEEYMYVNILFWIVYDDNFFKY